MSSLIDALPFAPFAGKWIDLPVGTTLEHRASWKRVAVLESRGDWSHVQYVRADGHQGQRHRGGIGSLGTSSCAADYPNAARLGDNEK